MPLKKDDSAKTIGLVMIIILIGKLTGLYRDMRLLEAYGTDTVEAMAFTVASNIPRNFLDFTFASVISASFIPIFNTYLEKKDKKQAFDLANNFITIVIILSGALTVLGALFSSPIVGVLASGYSAETKALTSQLLKIMMLTIVISGTAFSLTGILQSLGEFNIPAAMSIPSNCLIIFYCVFLIDDYGVFGLAVVFVLGWLTQVLIQIPSLIKKGYRFRFKIDLKDSGLREIGLMTVPVLISQWAVPVNFIVNQMVASNVYSGAGTTAINTANTLYSVITGVLILSISNVIFPRLSKQKALDDSKAFSDTMQTTIRGMMFFLIPMMCGLIVLSEPVIRVFFERGAFDAVSTQRTAIALRFYSLGMVGYGLQTILSRGFYASKDGKTPMLTSIFAIAVNLILSYGTVSALGIGGPALAASVSINATGLIMLFVMGRKNKGMFTKKLGLDLLKMAACSAVMASAVYVLMNYMLSSVNDGMAGRLITVAVPVFAGVIIYILLAFLLKIDEARSIFSLLRRADNE